MNNIHSTEGPWEGLGDITRGGELPPLGSGVDRVSERLREALADLPLYQEAGKPVRLSRFTKIQMDREARKKAAKKRPRKRRKVGRPRTHHKVRKVINRIRYWSKREKEIVRNRKYEYSLEGWYSRLKRDTTRFPGREYGWRLEEFRDWLAAEGSRLGYSVFELLRLREAGKVMVDRLDRTKGITSTNCRLVLTLDR